MKTIRKRHYLHLIIFLIIGVIFYIIGSGCGASGGGGTPVNPFIVGPLGGTITTGNFKLMIPQGALTNEVLFSISAYSTTDADVIENSSYDVGPSGLVFEIPVAINIFYTESTIESQYMLGSLNNGQWLGIGDSTVETSTNYVTGETNSLSVYGIVTTGADTVGSLEINITNSTTTLAFGAEYTLTAVAYPNTGLNLDYTWSSNLPEIVSINSDGVIRSETLGITTVYAYAIGKKSSPCTVVSGDLNIASVEVTPEAAGVLQGGTQQFYAVAKNAAGQVIPNEYISSFYWYSSNESIATIDQNGLATSITVGACAIHASNEGFVSNAALLDVVSIPQWNSSVPADNNASVGWYTSILIDSSGNPHISYYDFGNGNLKYASWEGSSWNIQNVDISANNVGEFTSLALDTNDNPRISYTSFTDRSLKYASWEGSGWDISTIESPGTLLKFTSLVLDATDNPWISYYSFNAGSLKYASWEGSSWNIQNVDTIGDIGQYSSIALDGSGNPHISYYDFANEDLKYVKYNGTSWDTLQTIDSTYEVGVYSSLALNASGDPLISYRDDTNQSLKCAWYDGTWHTETVDSSGNVGWYCNIALDASGNPRIAYYDNTNKDLKFAWKTGSFWYTQTIESAGDVGAHADIAIKNGKANISYLGNGNLRYISEQ